MNFVACLPPFVCEPISTDARLWSVTPFARSTTAAGRSSYFKPTIHCASCLLRDAILVLQFVEPSVDRCAAFHHGFDFRVAQARFLQHFHALLAELRRGIPVLARAARPLVRK